MSVSVDSNTTNIQPTRKAVVGFDPVHIVEKPPESFFCPLCDNVLRKPVQTARGEIACSECYYRHKGDKNICPIDNAIIDDLQLFPDRAKEREILTLSVRCFYQKFGCEWTGKLKNLEDHTTICEHAPVKCDQCGETVPSTAEHYKQCPVLCSRVVCPFAMVGCKYQAESELDLCTHIQNSLQIHNTRIVNHIESVRIENTDRLMEAVYKINEENRVLRRQNDTLVKRVDSMKDLLDQVLNKLDGKETGNSGAKTGEKARQNNAGMTQSNESSQKKGASKGASADVLVVEQVEKNKQEIRQVNSTISNLSSHLSDVDLRHQLHENTTYDGRMLWKIDTFKQRMKQAINGKTTALHSAPAFTCKYGYKFCCRLYLNGEGEVNKGKYVSLYFVLMRSEFDNLLVWPFEKKVVFTLKNQIDHTRDVRKVFSADPKSTSFMKPQKQMNAATGCPQFVLQSKLNESGFVKDDCFYLEIQVQV